MYQHVLAWRDALEEAGFPLAVWRIHRRIGISGGLFVSAPARETGQRPGPEVQRMQHLHAEAFRRYSAQVRPLPGARELIAFLTQAGVPHAVATSGYRESAAPSLQPSDSAPKSPSSRVAVIGAKKHRGIKVTARHLAEIRV